MVSQRGQSNCVLLKLPGDVYNWICCYWLNLKELGSLDIAMTQWSVRDEWLEQLKSKSMIDLLQEVDVWFGEGCGVKASDLLFFQWIHLRNIPMNKLFLRSEHLDCAGNLKYQVNYEHIEIIRESELQREPVSSIVNNCLNVTTLESVKELDYLMLVNPSVMSNLTCIDQKVYNKKHTVSSETVESIAVNCHLLIKLRLPSLCVNYIRFHDIIRNNHSLVSIKFNSDWKALELILVHCPKIEIIGISVVDSSDFDSIDKNILMKIWKLKGFEVLHKGNVVEIVGKDLKIIFKTDFNNVLSFVLSTSNDLVTVELVGVTELSPILIEIVRKSTHSLKKIRLKQLDVVNESTINVILQCKVLTDLKLMHPLTNRRTRIQPLETTIRILKYLEATLEVFWTSYLPGADYLKAMFAFIQTYKKGQNFTFELHSHPTPVIVKDGKLVERE